jgi:hypothetical protein
VQEGLARGYKLGIMASSDAHGDHPGAYDLGLIAAYAGELTRPSLWQAFKARRIYGVTGDRMLLDVSLNGHPMGSVVPRTTGPRMIEIDAVAWDKVERLDIIKNNQLLHSVVEPAGAAPPTGGPLCFRFMVEWGWDRKATNDWEGGAEVPGGRVLRAIPCYRGRVANRVGRGVTQRSERTCTWTSRTEQVQGAAPARRFGDALWLEVECERQAPLRLWMACGGRRQELTVTPADILSRSILTHMEPVAVTDNGNHWATMGTLAKFRVDQGWPTDQLTLHLRVEDDAAPVPGRTDFYYVRLIQRNGQRAWSSPIWVQ